MSETDVENDPNAQTYIRMKDELSRLHPREYVAFVDGQYVGHNRDEKKLVADTLKQYGKVQLVQPTGEMKVVRLRSPRRVLR